MIFVILIFCYTYFFPRWADPNQNSRLDMVIAVVDDGTFRIDDYVDNTVDYAKVGEHYYSDKAPGAAFLGIPVYTVLSRILDLPLLDGLMTRLSNNAAFQATLREGGTGLSNTKVRFAIAQVALTLVTAAIPTALLSTFMFLLLDKLKVSLDNRILIVLGYGLFTPVFAYAGAFYGHQLSAACLFIAFYMIFTSDGILSPTALLGVGTLLGYSVITEYPTVLITGILFLYTFYKLANKKAILFVMLSGSAIAVGWMIYNTFIFGGPFSLGYSYSELWQEQHHTGFMSLGLPHWEALWGITFSKFRGLFFFSPLWLLTLPGFYFWWKSEEHRPEFWVVLTSSMAMFVFNASSTMWWGGFAVGPRYLLPMLPFTILALAFTQRAWQKKLWYRIVSTVFYISSLLTTWGLTLAGQAFPSDTIRNPLMDYALPNWQKGNIARNIGMFLHLKGIPSLIPLCIGLIILLLVLWRLSQKNSTATDKEQSNVLPT